MSYSILIMGMSGTGKTCSLRNLDPKKTLLIQPVRKPLPFRSSEWREGMGGNIYVNANVLEIVATIKAAPHDIIVIDDFQYFLINAYMARRAEKNYEKFSAFAGMGFDLVRAASDLGNNKRVYILGHTTADEFGRVHLKTIGKMLDQVIVLEGMFTIVLRTGVDQASGRYYFSTRNSGNDTVKAPLDMFSEPEIENDLALVDKIVCEYWGIETTTNKPTNN